MSDIGKAIKENNLNRAEQLIKDDLPEVLKEKATLLHLATQTNADIKIVSALIEALEVTHAVINKKDDFGYTPLHYAVSNGNDLKKLNCSLVLVPM